MKKGLTILTVLALLFTILLAGCGNGDKEDASGVSDEKKTETPSGKITLKIARTGYSDLRPPAKDLWMWKKYEEKSGMQVEWEEIPGGSLAERKNVIIGSNDLPDAFYQIGFSQDELIKYGSQGLFIPLEDMIEKEAPNLQKLFTDHPDIKRALTMPDGHIYSLPYIDFSKAYASLRIYINKKWLDNLGLPVPKTTEEFRSTLKAFHEKDANGDGTAGNEMSWVAPTGTLNWTLERQLFGSFGMGNGGLKANSNWIYKDKDGQLKTIFNDPKYKEVWKYLIELYNDKSLPQQNFSGYEYAQWVADGAKDLVGAFSWVGADYLGSDVKKNFIGINVLEGPNGDKVVNWMDPPTRGISSFIITNKNKHPEQTLKWVDYFYGEEGSKFGTLGIEGETYNMVDGKPVYIDQIANYKGGLQLGAFQYVDNVYGGDYPYVEPLDELRTAIKGTTVAQDILADTAELEKYAPEERWPDFMPTPEESKQTSAIMTDINKYIAEMRVKFITGKLDLDAEWDNYVATLNKMGAEKYVEIKRAQYERYNNVK
ncbi:extracellular solute-binding protein [Paenibacillus sp. OSY-SE]|uniref:extracellular solute-binding protein n=1 Tax=Paenibacillus sp. OSY-SE TaxID=1196323 RepID=UPI00047468AB|nr:extracellular solute-binding protein [Paenibacillus sp. OSY-SE]